MSCRWRFAVGLTAAVASLLVLAAGAGARTDAKRPKPHKPATPLRRIYWGAYMNGPSTYGGSYHDAPWDDNTWRTFERSAGKRPSIVHFGVPPPWQQSFNLQLAQHRKIRNAGALELLDIASGSVPLRDIASGKYDSAIYEWAKEARAFGYPLFLRWDWEMNGRWFPWATMPGQATTADEYVQAWRHMHDLFVRAGARNVSWVWCPNVAFNGSTPYAAVYPGSAYVDWTCLDGYNKGGVDSKSFVDLFKASYHQLLALAPNKPIMIGETASVDDAGKKPGWITSALSALPAKFPRIKAFLWFNWNISEAGTTWAWQIESSPESAAAFAHGIASPYFASAGSVRLPKRMTAIVPLTPSP